MPDKTDELRDIFQSVAAEDTVTESQEEGRGSLTADPEGAEEEILDVIERMREQYDFASGLSDDALVTVVRRFFRDGDDAAIADAIRADGDDTPDEVDEETVFTARLDLHLVRDDDADETQVEVVRRQSDADADDETFARETGASVEAIRRARRVLATRTEARQVSDRYRSAFEDALAEAGLTAPMTAGVRDDGLDEATEDIGSLESDADVDF